MLRRFYNLLFPVAFLLILPGYLRRMFRRGNYRSNFGQRFGYYTVDTRKRLAERRGTLWLQAVSVGEMLVALKLVAALREQDPQISLILSTTTTTAFALAAAQAPSDVEVLYSPVDLAGAVGRAFDAIRPAQLMIVDGGLWPNQLWEARRRGVPTALVNARLSPRSERRFRRFPRLASALFGLLDLVCVTETNDVERWKRLGVNAAHLLHTGSIKFDDAMSATPVRSAENAGLTFGGGVRQNPLALLKIPPGTAVILAGSTHPGEELAVAKIVIRLRARFPNLFFIVAPRHVERCEQVRAELTELGLHVVLRTNLPISAPLTTPDTLLINTTGELRDWYHMATLVFVGKSLLAHGGQNPVEAIIAGTPIIVGPHMENFAEITAKLLSAKAVIQVIDAAELEGSCTQLLPDPAERERMVAAAQNEILPHRGSAIRTAVAIQEQRRNFPCQAA